ncbi:MAG: AtpZ/AtpI family protein [Xanthobacteraceae bacterium]
MAADRPPDDRSRWARDAEEAALSARLRRLGDRLGALSPKPRDREEKAAAGPAGNPTNLARALRLSSEFIAGIVVGGVLGWLFDRLTGWSPWGLIVFLMLGFVAGTLNAMRSAGLIAKQGQDSK